MSQTWDLTLVEGAWRTGLPWWGAPVGRQEAAAAPDKTLKEQGNQSTSHC